MGHDILFSNQVSPVVRWVSVRTGILGTLTRVYIHWAGQIVIVHVGSAGDIRDVFVVFGPTILGTVL